MTMTILAALALVLFVIAIALLSAMLEAIEEIRALMQISIDEEDDTGEELEERPRPPNEANPQAHADQEHRAPMVRRAAERLYRRRIEG